MTLSTLNAKGLSLNLLFSVFLNIVDSVLYGLNGFSLIIRNRDTKLFFKLHNQLYCVK